jgi:membrane fusion protein (multidrug efflux system)
MALAALLGLAACGKSAAPAATAPPPTEVRVHTVRAGSVPMASEFNGRVVVAVTAEIRPQTGGIVLKRSFTEGSEVRAGQVLYQIDPATAKTAVASAQATLDSAKASLVTAREKALRYRQLVAIEAVSRESADEAEASFTQARSTVASAEASLKSASIALGYANVTSPIDGRIGRSSVSQGALVTAGQTTALATVRQLDPIYVDVTQSAADMLRIRRNFEKGVFKLDGGRPVTRLVLEDGSAYELAGHLQLADGVVDETTGTVTLRAQFPNPKRHLLPGMYVRMRIEGAVEQNALTVPQVAISRDVKGNALAYVVGPDNKVQQRTLSTRQATGDQWVVDQGLAAGERVIVEGLQKVRTGAVVKVVEAAPAALAAAASRASTN